MGSFEDEPKNSTNAGQNASLKLYKPTEDLLEGMHRSAGSETSGLVGGVCDGTDDESTIENNFTSPPKLDPVEFVPSPQMQDESSEMIPNDTCALAEEHVTEVALHGNKEELELDAFASIKINVLPHGIAELWFAGKMTEDKELQKNIDVQTSSKDQVDVEVLEHSDYQVDVNILDYGEDQVEIEIPDHSDDQVDVNILDNSDDQVEIEILDHSDDQIKVIFPEKHAEDIKPIEWNNLGEVDEKLESYCCIAKWFQALNYGDGSFCMCQVKTELSEQKLEIRASDTSVKMDTYEEDRFGVISKEHGCIDLKVDLFTTDEKSSESTKALLTLDAGTPNYAAVDNIRTVKACPVSEVISETSEQINDDSPSKCATDKIPMLSEKTKPSPDVKKSSETVCLSLYGSSNRRDRLIRNKIYKNGGQKPPEDLERTIGSHQKNDRRMSNKRKWDELIETEDVSNVRKKNVRVSPQSSPQGHKAAPVKVSEVTNENALSSSALTRKRFNPPHNSKSLSKKKKSLGTRQISMNNYVTRRKTMSPKSLHSPEPVLKSKYELRNPALMPLQEDFGLEFKVLPSTFNFKDGTEPANIQADALSRAKNGIPYTEDKKVKGRKTIHAPVQGKWSLSPLKSKQIQSADVSSSCSLFREFKKRYQDKKKELVSRQNLNSN
ncbi:uncharacterized protein si:ch211-106e7.2 isoform X2 [Triplophysa dalaica]|nr:uncharacterized protein si:ch211-106e7.2 isoform X2 [Triplophysa dalaica]